MLDLIASYIVRGLNAVFHVMPMGLNLWAGRAFGYLIYLLSGKRRKVTYRNIRAAFASEKSPRDIRRLTIGTYRNMVQTFVEILALTKVDREYLEKHLEIINSENLGKAASNPRGMIMVSAHFGNWEMSTVASVFQGYPLYLLARDQKMQRLNELLNRLRESKGNIVIRKGADIKNLFRVLKEGKSVGILADQNAGPNGKLVNLFGRPASTAVGPYRFAQKTGAWILPAFIHRVDGPYHQAVLEEPMVIGKNEDITPYVEKYNELLEKHVRKSPDQWMWMHKKWKLTPVRKVLVLDDGKKGHFKQSMAVAGTAGRYWKEKRNMPEGALEVKTVSVKFKSRVRRTILNMFSPLYGDLFQGRPFLLKWALEPGSYDAIISVYADVVISCGSALYGVNRLVSSENGAKNLTIMDPGRMNRWGFDLIVLPRHDVVRKGLSPIGANVVVTDMPPTLVDISELEDLRGKERNGLDGIKCVGVLIGGENRFYTFSEATARDISEALSGSCGDTGTRFMLTTSRRTPPDADKTFQDMLREDERCLKFVSGKSDNDAKTVDKILASSDIVFVTGDSISMVSEAVSSGRPVFVIMPDKKRRGKTKYDVFVDELAGRGYLKKLRREVLAEDMRTAMTTGMAARHLPEDMDELYSKIEKVF
ncbi:MAG: ELM1/GtrOC1 family putative glycosyltransferase [Candidatus Omnitrophica bacterium]|nr:ELM1/GtrOC1 family putative glycosyltransferase [Candidatus Omnitrophota bacterium]MDD5487620.1 ELM1/GtrOC1 family putative glycosyltransferase [Candidatus Omnitrophota bacterium]